MSVWKSLRKTLDILSLSLMLLLAPVTVGVLVSSNALPGDKTYPLKLGLENLAVFTSQVRPAWEMDLRLAVLDRRYSEARQLLEEEASPRGYRYFVDAAQATERAVLGIKDEGLRARYNEELVADLERYNRELEGLINNLTAP